MIINFENMEKNIIPHFNNGEKDFEAYMFKNGDVKILKGRLIEGASIGLHTHLTSSETIYILSGKAKVLYDDTVEYLTAGMSHYCPKGHSHSLINEDKDDLIFFAVVPEL